MGPKLCVCFLVMVGSLACYSGKPALPPTDASVFAGHWRQGKAEITRYALSQARYGEVHQGDAVLIFVTEPFLSEAQVKRDQGSDSAYEVLKLNATRTFNTGVYPYSLMTSTFTRVDFQEPYTPKVTFTAQEWCGHVYMQLNQRGSGYQGLLHSYFQNEADRNFALPREPLEDELWTIIRMAPNQLPTGRLQMIPAAHVLRLQHLEAGAYKVEARLEELATSEFGSEPQWRYSLNYEKLERLLEVFFEQQPPHRILGWREEGYSGWGDGRVKLVTEGKATHREWLDYWSRNKKADLPLREKLGLKP